MEWSTACPDWEQRIVERRSLIPFDPLFPDEAEAALAVFKSLRVVDVPGMPTFGECCEQWVFDFVAAIFGAYDAESGKRLVREFLLLISKKNGKSTIAAGIMLTALIRNWRYSNELLILAPTMEIANNSFNPAADMVRQDDELRDLLHIQSHLRSITHRVTGAVLRVVAADTDTVGGKKAGMVLVDELWLFGKRVNSPAMLQEATGGLVSKAEGFVVYLTTHSDEPPAGVFKSKLEYFRDIRDGVVQDNKRLGVLYEMPKALVDSGDYLKPENFYVTNPNLGRSVSGEWIEDQLREIQAGGKDAEGQDIQTFLAKHLNIQIGQSTRRDRWAGADFWVSGTDATITLQTLIARSEVITIGIDGGGLDDLLSIYVIGRDKDNPKHWLGWGRSWAHPSVLERRKNQREVLLDFVKDGDLYVIDELGSDIDALVAIAAEVDASDRLAMIGLDPAGVGLIVDALGEIGIGTTPEVDRTEKPRVVSVSQGWPLQGAIKTLERKLADGTFTHADQALLGYAIGNAKTEIKGNAVMITKQLAGASKIDPLMAAFDAVALMSKNPTPLYQSTPWDDDPEYRMTA